MTLVNVGLKSLDGIKLPRLRTCNVENNAIADLKSVVAFVASCSLLESLNLQGNPCATKPRARERLAAAAPHRKEAFLACQMCIDLIKLEVPIWKKEVAKDGSEWIGERP